MAQQNEDIKFIGNIGHFQQPPPYIFNGVTIREFVLKASFEAVEKLVDTCLNIPRGHTWTPVGNTVNMLLVSYDEMRGAHGNKGFTRQDELAFQILLDGPGTLAWYAPFLVVNNPLSLIIGREVSGFPKAWGSFEIPKEEPWMPAKVETWAFDSDDEDSEFKSRTLVTIEQDGADAKGDSDKIVGWPFNLKNSKRRQCRRHAERAHLDKKPENGGGIGFEFCVDAIQMREFQDFQNADNAAYQAINRAKYQMLEEISLEDPMGGELPAPKITLNNYPGLDLTSTLGLKLHDRGHLKGSLIVEDARWCRLDQMKLIDPAVAYTA